MQPQQQELEQPEQSEQQRSAGKRQRGDDEEAVCQHAAVAPHVFVGGPAWELRPDVVPEIDVARLAALAAEVDANGVKVLACVNKTLIRDELATACGYRDQSEPIIPWRVGRDFGCLELFSVAAHGASPAEQNMGYTMVNHKDMLLDEPRVRCTVKLHVSEYDIGRCAEKLSVDVHGQVRGYADAIGEVALGRRAIDIGSGPHCLLARLVVNAGASRVDAIEQNDSFVLHAIDAFKAEAAGESTHAAIVSLRSCAGAAALGPMFDVTIEHADPPPEVRAMEVKTCAEGAAAAGVHVATPTDTGEVRCKVALRMKGTGIGAAWTSSDGEDMEPSSSDEDGVDVEGAEEGQEEEELEDGCSSLYLHHGYSTTCSLLRGGYDLVVHEILGHVSNSSAHDVLCLCTVCHCHFRLACRMITLSECNPGGVV